MKSQTIAKSPVGRLFVTILGMAMESRFRYRFFGPVNILEGADDLSGHTVLGSRQVGDMVNLEIDIIAKYVERLHQPQRTEITAEYLREHGFSVG